MRNKKAPSLAAVGAGKKGGKWEETWADPAPAPRQSWLCRVCRHGIVPSFRAAIIGLVGCRSHYLPDGRGWPVLCPGFKVKEGCHAA